MKEFLEERRVEWNRDEKKRKETYSNEIPKNFKDRTWLEEWDYSAKLIKELFTSHFHERS